MPESPIRQPDRIDEHLRVLAVHRRRAIVEYLRHNATGTATLQELADVLEMPEVADSGDLLGHLHHTALPRLADSGSSSTA